MPPSSQPVNVSRKFLRLGLAIVVIAALYSAAWFFAANRGATYLKDILAAPGGGFSASCGKLDIRGFPFRAGVFCESASLANATDGLKVETGPVRTMTLVYNPTKAVFEVDGPIKAELPQGISLDTNWGNMEGSLHANLQGMTEVSTFVDKMTTAAGFAGIADAVKLNVGHAEFHARQNGENLDIAAMAQETTLSTPLLPRQLPLFSTSAEITVNNRADLLRGARLQPGDEISGTIQRLALDFGAEGFLTISGPFQIGGDGLISGDFDIDVENFARLQPLLDASFPESQPVIDASTLLIKGISKDGVKGRVKIAVRSGAILLGVIPIGFIPPL